jgi:hypothetical protein
MHQTLTAHESTQTLGQHTLHLDPFKDTTMPGTTIASFTVKILQQIDSGPTWSTLLNPQVIS